ncbi:MAG: peptidase M15 [Pseudomonadota bacterium]
MNWTVAKLEKLGRTRLSANFFMREMLHSEIAQVNGMVNAPTDEKLAIHAGSQLCQQVLEPLMAAWGKIVVRSAYRSEEVNAWGNANKANCASNERNYAGHIWDRRDANGFAGATASIVIPRYLDYYERTGDWASLAWWIHHYIDACHELTFFPKQCAFNIRWYEDNAALKSIKTFAVNPHTGDKSVLLNNGVLHPHYAAMTPQERFAPCNDLTLAPLPTAITGFASSVNHACDQWE